MNTWKQTFGKKVITNFYNPSEVDKIYSVVQKFEQEQDRKDYIWKYFEKDKTTISRIEYFINHNLFLNELANSDKIIKEVNLLMDEESIIFKDKINFKYPSGEGFKPHQDIAAGWGEYCNRHITFALPFSDTTEENGCIYFGDTQQEQLTNTFEDLSDDVRMEPVYTKKGDIILFDSYVPHASYENKTNEARSILFFTYTPASEGNYYEQYHVDKFKNVPPDIYKVEGKKYKSGNSNSDEREY